MQNTTIGTAQIKLVVDASQVQQGLNEAKTTVETTTATTEKSFDGVQQRIDGTGAAAERFGQDVENAGRRGGGAIEGLKRAVAGLGTAIGTFNLGLRVGNTLFGESDTLKQFFEEQALGSKKSLADIQKELDKVQSQLVGMLGENTAARVVNQIYAFLGIENRKYISELIEIRDTLSEKIRTTAREELTLREKLSEQERAKRTELIEKLATESAARAEEIAASELEGVERVEYEQNKALNRISELRRKLNETDADEAAKLAASVALDQEEAAVRRLAASERARIAEREAAEAAREKARAEQESARAMEQQTRESERKAQVDQQARAQAQRDQMLANALDRQAVALDKVLQAIQLQTEITKSLRRVL